MWKGVNLRNVVINVNLTSIYCESHKIMKVKMFNLHECEKVMKQIIMMLFQRNKKPRISTSFYVLSLSFEVLKPKYVISEYVCLMKQQTSPFKCHLCKP